ncbi:lysozyme inhibitor LprI family protein [Franconibacter pulveris]|uniref:lysozyme inhibitor LprI family protein n=1 Tax=Franconibacter pulveris TaxID=435910 RepID=UPI0004983EA1|nr:lysozyme inhibitor LprI family protein [Franconibacter pulveris]
MKKTLITIILMTLIPSAYSTEKLDIIAGPEIDNCWRNNADRGKASECLHVLSDKSNKEMDELIAKTVRQIKENNSGPVYKGEDPQQTIGDVFSNLFLDSQNSWKEYRKNLCLGVGSQIGEDAYDYWPYIYQCQINLNKRHVEEIKMIRADEK